MGYIGESLKPFIDTFVDKSLCTLFDIEKTIKKIVDFSIATKYRTNTSCTVFKHLSSVLLQPTQVSLVFAMICNDFV